MRDAIGDGEMKQYLVGRVAILVLRKGDKYFALRDTCPHQGAPLSAGWLTGTALPSEPGSIDYGRSGEIIRCPWHNWEFDAFTGRSLHDPVKQRVRAYRVSIDDSGVFVETGRGANPQPS
jgi:3-phenylpropionate/trans-cinnamate dioxygenase ferredoxin subunit